MINTKQLTGSKTFQGESWAYFPPKEYEALPLEHKDQLFYLDKDSTQQVYNVADNYDIICGDDGWGNKPFSRGCYEEVVKTENWKNEDELKKWLYKCGVPFKSEVLLLPVFSSDDTPVLLTTWKMLVKYAETFFAYDNLIAVDPKLSWCLYYHHDDIIYFAKGRVFKKN